MIFSAFKDEDDRRRAPWRYDAEEEEAPGFYDEDGVDEETGEEDEESGKAPVALRAVVWAAVIIVFFAIGYWGSGIALNWLDNKGIIGDEQVVQSTDEARQVSTEGGEESESANGPKSRFLVYIPSGDAFREESVSFVAGLLEDDLQNVLSELVRTYREEELISGDVRVLHVFRNGDKVYLDLNAPFLESVSKMTKDKAVSVITGIVSTVSKNFSPVTRIRFLINGKEVDETKPVDLSSFWAMPS
ncbi:MAG: GerMN domain-containing protein [Thermovirgaceae bacterium]